MRPLADFCVVFLLTGFGLAAAITQPVIFAICIGMTLLSMPFVIRDRRKAEEKWRCLKDLFASPLFLPAGSHSLQTISQVEFVAVHQDLVWMPEAGVFFNQENDALRIVSHDGKYDVVLPIEMIHQIEFDSGDGPIGQRNKKTSLTKRLLGRYYLPTVFLGVMCKDRELVVYPLCFHPEMEAEARAFYERIQTKFDNAPAKTICPLSADEFERALPDSLEARDLPQSMMLRFWPDYTGARVIAWLSH